MAAGDVTAVLSKAQTKGTNDGTPSGGVTISDGAMVFDATGRVSLGNPTALNFNSTTPYAISLWIKPNAVAGAQMIFAKDGGGGAGSYEVYLFDRNVLFRQSGNFVVTSGNLANAGEVIHILALNDRNATGNSKIYINGNLSISGTIANVDVGTGLNAFIGGRNAGGSWFNGSVYTSSVYNKALTTTEITQIYNAGKDAYSPVTSGLVAQYSGRDYFGTAAAPKKILDAKRADQKMIETNIHQQRVTANDKWLIYRGQEGQVGSVAVEEA